MQNTNLELINIYSKNNNFQISFDTEKLIDNYITSRETKPFIEKELLNDFNHLISEIDYNETTFNHDLIRTIHDIDLFFKDCKSNKLYLVEIKYNDDHDTGKFVNINRKLLKTYAYVKRQYPNSNITPILFYFYNKISKGNIYIPEQTNIYRGGKFFKQFLKISYDELDNYFSSISESPEVIKSFDDLYERIMLYEKK